MPLEDTLEDAMPADDLFKVGALDDTSTDPEAEILDDGALNVILDNGMLDNTLVDATLEDAELDKTPE